jgi:Protein of unknown function (DUF2924)
VVAAIVAAQPKGISMPKTKSKRKTASRASDSKTKTRNSVRRTTAREAAPLKPVTKPAAHQQPQSAPQPTVSCQSKRLTSLQCCERQAARPSRRWHVQRSGNPIRSAASSPVSCARSSASRLSRQSARMLASTGLRIAPRQWRRSAMRQSTLVAKKATRPSLDDEIAHLRDLDLHGLRARWKSVFRQQPPYHLPRHLLFAVLGYRLQADELGDLDPATTRLLRQIAAAGGTSEASRLTEGFGRRRTLRSRLLAFLIG